MQQFVITACIVWLVSSNAAAQPTRCLECDLLLDRAIAVMRNHSVNAAEVDWDRITTEAKALAHFAQAPRDLEQAFIHLFASLHDFHGVFFHGDSIQFKWAHNEPVINEAIRAEFMRGVAIKTAVIDDRYGYLQIPSMPAFSKIDMHRLAQSLNDSLCTLLDFGVSGLIIDLRLNGGGAMHPMILGVQQLLGTGKIGAHVTSTTEDWIIDKRDFRVDTMIMARIAPTCDLDASTMPVALLTSPVTGSAAECLIVALQGRPNTILVGTATAGFLSINQGFMLTENASMNLSVGYNADRAGTVYRHAFQPDIAVDAMDEFTTLEVDPKVMAALDRLSQMCE